MCCACSGAGGGADERTAAGGGDEEVTREIAWRAIVNINTFVCDTCHTRVPLRVRSVEQQRSPPCALAARRPVAVCVHACHRDLGGVDAQRGSLRLRDGLRHGRSLRVGSHLGRADIAVVERVRSQIVAHRVEVLVGNVQGEAAGHLPAAACATQADCSADARSASDDSACASRLTRRVVAVRVDARDLHLAHVDTRRLRHALAERQEHSRRLRVCEDTRADQQQYPRPAAPLAL